MSMFKEFFFSPLLLAQGHLLTYTHILDISTDVDK